MKTLSLALALAATSLATVATAQSAVETCGMNYTLAANGPVTMAVCAGDIAKVKTLTVNTGVNIKDPMGLSPLEVTFASSTVYWQPILPELYPMIDYLLSAGADTNIEVKWDNNASPLAMAALIGDASLAAKLIAAGADVNRGNSNGNTPLHEAAYCDFRLSSDAGSVAVIKLLLAKGANVHATNAEGKTPFQTVVTPCSFAPEQCTDSALASSAEWPTGSCKQTYLLLRKAAN